MAKNETVERLAVRKMYKLYIGGAFARSESGRSDPFGSGANVSNVSRASRKDLRDAVVAARSGAHAWAGMSPALRGQILYRLTEMMEARRAELIDRVAAGAGIASDDAAREVDGAIDRTLWYAGWCDKYASVVSSRNPVSGPHFTFSSPEPIGIVGAIAPDAPSLLGLVTAVIPPLVSGNAVVAVASEIDPCTAIVFAECVATSDLPAGALNVLTGKRIELAPHLARHMEVGALAAFGLDGPFAAELVRLGAENLKRSHVEDAPARNGWFSSEYDDLARVSAFTELKTIWHPAGI